MIHLLFESGIPQSSAYAFTTSLLVVTLSIGRDQGFQMDKKRMRPK